LNGSASSIQLAQWLVANFPRLYGSGAGAHAVIKNGAYLTNAQVASAYRNAFYTTGTNNTDAQVLSAALSVYVTSTILAGGTYAATYGFRVTTGCSGAHAYNVGSNGAGFGVANNTSWGVLELLTDVDRLASTAGVIANSTKVKTVVTGINAAGAITLLSGSGSAEGAVLLGSFHD